MIRISIDPLSPYPRLRRVRLLQFKSDLRIEQLVQVDAERHRVQMSARPDPGDEDGEDRTREESWSCPSVRRLDLIRHLTTPRSP